MKNQASIQLLKVGTPINPNADTGHIMLCADADGNLRIFGENGVELPIGSAVDESRLVPTGGRNGNTLGYQEGADRGNGADVKLLLQDALTDTANGNASPAAVTTEGVTLTEDKTLQFNGNGSYVSAVLPNDIFAADKEWTIDGWIKPVANSSEWNYILTDNAGDWGTRSIGLTWNTADNVLEQDTGGYVASVIKAPNWPNAKIACAANEWHFIAVEKQKTSSGWFLNYYLNGSIWLQVPFTGEFVPFDITDPFRFGGRTSDGGREFKGEANRIRVTAGARYGGKAFVTPDRNTEYKAPVGQPVWEKGIDRSRLLPENPTNGDIACFDADVVVGSNDETVKFLLQPVTSNKELVDSAYGNPTKVVINNHGLTVDSNCAVVFTTSTYGTIAADTLPADVLVHDKPWVIDLLMKLDEGQWSGTELVYFGSEGSGTNFWFQWTDNYKFECNYDGKWTGTELGNLGEEHLVTLEYYQDTDSNWYTALYLDGTFRGKKQVSSSTDMRNYDLCIGRRSSGKSPCSGQFKAIRIRAGAPYKGQTFTPDEFPYQEPQTVGEWGKFNISSLVKSVNGQTPDENGNVVIETSDGTLDLSNYSGALKLTVPTGTFSIGDSSGNFINTVGTTLVLQGNEKVQLTAYNADTRHTLAIGSDGLLYDDHAINTASGIVVLGSDGKLPALDGSKLTNLPAVAWGDIPEKPETFPASAHNHAITDVTGLEDALQNAGTVKSVNGATPDSSGAVTLPEATASAAGLMAAADKAKLDGISTSEAWYTVADAAAITLDRANGELQKVTLTQNCVLTAPVLDADHSTLLLQVTSSSAVTVTVGETNIVTDHTGTFQVGWYWDGEATRRYPAVEIS